jgi:hypothetical protein
MQDVNKLIQYLQLANTTILDINKVCMALTKALSDINLPEIEKTVIQTFLHQICQTTINYTKTAQELVNKE